MDLCLDSTRCGSGGGGGGGGVGGGGGGIGGGRGDRVVVVGVVCHVFAVTLTPPIVSIAIPFGVTFLDPNYTFGETKKRKYNGCFRQPTKLQ